MIDAQTLDSYLKQVRRGMRRMDPKVADGIIAELRDSIVQRGVIEESPEEVASAFIEIYGFGRCYLIRFYILSAIMALLSIPISAGHPLLALGAITFYFALSVFLVWFGALAGKKAGLTAGTVSLIARIIPIPILMASGYIITGGGILFLLISSLVLPLLGWIPGEVVEARPPKY